MSNKIKHVLELSVHQLVDFLLRTGDIDNRVFNRSSMNEGTLIHALYQSKQGKNYLSEVPLKYEFMIGETVVSLEGRADGIISKGNNEFIVDEIKSTVMELQEFRDNNLSWHLGQAKCYAFMFAKMNNLNSIGIRLTYIKQGNVKEKLFDEYTFLISDLEQYIYSLLEDYLNFYNIVFRLNEERNESILSLPFPFDNYRQGQRELAKYSYSIAKNGGKLFVEAPTGIGKTMSTLYPFIKALKEDEKSKIFYLTAKNTGKNNAANAIQILKRKGLKALDILITAKEKICFCKDKACNPEECPFAKDYYTKIKDVIKAALLSYDTFDLETILAIAKTYSICPFELELDLSLFCDVIICDYNYMFDPISYMKRYFDEDSSHYLALIDEAHNLVERSRKMYSASISKKSFEEAKKSLRHIPNRSLKTQMSKISKLFASFDELGHGEHEFDDINYDHFKVLERFITVYQDVNKNHNKDITKELVNFYLDVNSFVKISEFYSTNYVYYVNKGSDTTLNLLCLDASKYVGSILKRIKGSTLFSATLSPIDYYVNLLGGDKENDPRLILSSPFPKENLLLSIAPNVSIKYKNRDSSYKDVCDYIKTFISPKIGNYFVYLPSYEYQKKLLKELGDIKGVNFHIQESEMSEIEKEEFLSNFKHNPKETHVGFVIIGGSFGEGVDLVSDRLSGVMIVGIGLSKINYESDKIALYYKNNGLNGYDYAYLYPGMNKVMQAIGRLIRSEADKGSVLLIDERYLTNEYQSLYKKQYPEYKVVFSPEEYLKNLLNSKLMV